jgi:hypothetical protein
MPYVKVRNRPVKGEEVSVLLSRRIPSRSQRGHSWTVEHLSDGRWLCDCPAGLWQRQGGAECRHIRQVKNELAGKTYKAD